MGFGHKRGGTKVSGVKLKPAIIPSNPTLSTSANGNSHSKGKQKETRSIEVEEAEEDQYDRSFMESIRKDKPPLSGCLICFTGIPDPIKYQAIAYAQKLGAKVEKNLTLEVTHLICDRPGSKKYHVALEHSIRVMLPLWLETLYSSFTEGEDIDLENITQRYTMKPLHNLKLAITGKASSSRTPFIKLAEDNGATISIDLDIECSHLIVLSLVLPNQTDPTIFDLAKVQAARRAESPIKVVWQDWLEDSVQRRGSLPEAPYLVKEGVPRPGRLVPDSESSNALQDQEAFARTMQKDEFEAAVPLKPIKSGSQNAIMASFILKQDLPIRRHHSDLSAKITNGQGYPNDPEELPKLFFSQTDLSDKPKHPPAQTDGSSAHSLYLKDVSKLSGPVSIVKKLRSVKSERFGSPTLSGNVSRASSPLIVPGLFRGLKISTIGCLPIHHRTLIDIVTQCGGQCTEVHSNADYTIVPHVNPPIIPANCNPVGHHWVEKSLFQSEIINPDAHWCGRPVRLSPLSNPSQYTFSSCGFSEVDEHILQQILKVANLKYVEHPRRSAVTHFLIGPDETSSRVQKVKTWTEKKLVDFEWLIEVCDGQRISRSSQQSSRRVDAHEPLLKSMNDPPQHNLNNGFHHTPLSECIIFMTRKGSLHPDSKALIDCRKLGARVVDKLVESVTHVVHVIDRSSDSSRELKVARSRNLHIVHPHWLSECQSKLIRADEMTFPPTYQPERALSYCASSATEITMADVTVNYLPENGRAAAVHPMHESSDPILEKDMSCYRSPSQLLTKLTGDVTSAVHSPPQKSNVCILDSKLDDTVDQVQNIAGPSSSHYATSPRSNMVETSSPINKPGPGVDTQLGGFMEILQQRNRIVDFPLKSKEKDSRRSRKRGLDQSSRASAHNQPVEKSPSLAIGGGLNRSLSNFSHSSTPGSQAAGFFGNNNIEESMNVTWEDPAAKREILKAINDPIGKATKRIAHRRQQNQQIELDRSKSLSPLNSSASNLHLVNRKTSRCEINGKDTFNNAGLASKKRSELHDEDENRFLENGDNDDEEITILHPIKKRKPRLVSR